MNNIRLLFTFLFCVILRSSLCFAAFLDKESSNLTPHLTSQPETLAQSSHSPLEGGGGVSGVRGGLITETRVYSTMNGMPSNIASCVAQDGRGLMWFGTWRGLCCFDGYDFINFNNAGQAEERPVCGRIHSIKLDIYNNVWCVTYDRRAYLFNTSQCQWTDVTKILEKKFGANFRVRNIYPLDSGVVWLTCYDEDEYTFRIPSIADLQGATNEFARMKEKRNERERTLWNKHKREKPDVSHIPTLKATRKNFIDSQSNIWNFDHQLTSYTTRKSLFTITEATPGRNTRTIPPTADMNGYQVYARLLDSKGRLWVGTKGGGLYLDGQRQEIHGKDVFDIFEDSKGNIWVACYDEGFNLLYDGKFVSDETRLKNISKGRRSQYTKVRHITETKDGVILLSTADGLLCFSSTFQRPEDIRFHAYTQGLGGNVMQTLQTDDGKIYVATMTGGLMTVTSGKPLDDNLVFEPVKETQNTEGIVLAFIEDTDNCLWLARENYLEKYDPQEHKTMIFRSKDFGQEVAFSEASPALSAATGEITFGTLGGMLTFNPKKLVKSGFTPQILFTSVQYQGSQECQPILYIDQIDVPADKRSLTIYFSALDYRDNELLQYAYRIVDDSDNISNLDNTGWNYVGRAHCASFNKLPCGHLRLLVKSTNADGVWTDNIAELRIYSHPTFLETPWAWLMYALIVAAIVAVAVWIVQMQHRHRLEKEQMQRKLQQLLESLNSMQEEEEGSNKTSAHWTPVLKDVEIESEEKKLMKKLMDYLDQHIADSELKIGDIADALGMSRSVFYDRVKTITGMSPVDFLRYLRMQRAKQILISSDLNISQIAYEVGFSDPNYFGKVFKKTIGMSPISYRKEHGMTIES